MSRNKEDKLDNFGPVFSKGELDLNTEFKNLDLTLMDAYQYITFSNKELILLKTTNLTENILITDYSTENTYKLTDFVENPKSKKITSEPLQVPAGSHVISSNEPWVNGMPPLIQLNLFARGAFKGCTDVFADNYDENAEVDDGSCLEEDDGMTKAGAMGDPHILTFGGNRCELPHSLDSYKFLQTNDFVANIDTKIVGDEVFIENLYVAHNNGQFIINLDTLQITNESGNEFEFTKVGPLTKLIVTKDRKYRILVNAEKNGVIIKPMFKITQEDSSGILMSDAFEECVIEKLH